MSDDLNDIGRKPQEVEDHNSTQKGVRMFFGKEEAELFSSLGREITEGWSQESFLLYRIDLQQISVHPLYGETKHKVYKESVEVFGRINTQSEDTTMHIDGGPIKRGHATMEAHLYLEHLQELGLVVLENDQDVVMDLKVGDYLEFKGQFFKIHEDGYAQINNQNSWAGDRRFYITIKAKEVDEDQFNAR